MDLLICFNTASGKYCCNLPEQETPGIYFIGFNTASGKYCCNFISLFYLLGGKLLVSIPQAVSTVATIDQSSPPRL